VLFIVNRFNYPPPPGGVHRRLKCNDNGARPLRINGGRNNPLFYPFQTAKSRKGERMMPQKKVKIYSLSTCSHCKSTKKLLTDCMVQYEFEDVDLLDGEERKLILEDIKKINPKCSFPTIIIGDKIIVGFKEKAIKEALGL
jgi:glutaredoxin